MPSGAPPWWARGLLFENCSCQLLCPAHVSFKQRCNDDRCIGHWAAHLVEGRFGSISLDDLNAVILFEAPVQMYSGDWTERIYLDDRGTPVQRAALEAIFSGSAGGPWEVLGRLVANRLDTQAVAMRFEDRVDSKRLIVPDLFETEVTALRGRNGDGSVTLSNLYNVIHGMVHVMARGRTVCRDDALSFSIDKTHGLYSEFSWSGGG